MMTFTFSGILQAVIDTVRAPKEGLRQVLMINVALRQKWEFLFLTVVLSAIIAQVTSVMAGLGRSDVTDPFPAGPFSLAIIQLVMLVSMTLAIYVVGRRVGGTGSLGDCVLLVAWLQFVLICLQVVQTVFILVYPPIATLVGLAGIALFFWLLANFISEVHGIKSIGAIVIGIFFVAVLFAVFISILLSFMGILPTEVVNV